MNYSTSGPSESEAIPTLPVSSVALTRPMTRHYDVQAGTGRVVSSVPQGQWWRGSLPQTAQQPGFEPPMLHPAPDPSSPTYAAEMGKLTGRRG